VSSEIKAVLSVSELKRLHLGPLSLRVGAGECVALTGASGTGKSMLLRAIADLDPNEGEVRLEGKRRETFSGHRWRRRVALLPAEPAWWAERVGEHFVTPPLALLQALGFAAEVLEWQVEHCSTGERQRLALARLLENRPRVVLLDEPTASLDSTNVRRVEELLAEYCANEAAALVWVSHDQEQLRRVATHRYHLADGSLQEVAL
jgi:ABC-type iron transport system FetAB ATPase subunit